MSDYGMRTELDLSFEEAIEAATTALKTQGFGVLTEIDVQGTLKKKLDVDFRRYQILGACNPALAHQALQNEMEIGLLLPCNVIVYETDGGKTTVSIVDPIAMLDVASTSALSGVAAEAKTRLGKVLAELQGL